MSVSSSPARTCRKFASMRTWTSLLGTEIGLLCLIFTFAAVIAVAPVADGSLCSGDTLVASQGVVLLLLGHKNGGFPAEVAIACQVLPAFATHVGPSAAAAVDPISLQVIAGKRVSIW